VGRLLFLEVLIPLYSFPVGRLLFRGVLPLFNGLPLTSGIFFSSKKGCPGGKYLPQLPKRGRVIRLRIEALKVALRYARILSKPIDS
jgi:hypothetical protein